MRTTLKRVRERTPAERWAALRASLLIAWLQTCLAVLPFRTVMRMVHRIAGPAGSAAPGAARPSHFDKDLAVWAVEAAGRRLLSKNPCLPKALAGLILLRRAGADAELHLGVARGGDSPVRAHAWVVSDGSVVIGGDVPLDDYTPLPGLGARFPDSRRPR
jgi:hypothetical protein